jgi:ABC-type multidrug transport system fused ATPase/permease subunit
LYQAIAWRFLYLGLAVGLFVFAFYAGIAIQLTQEQAEKIKRELGERNQNLDGFGIFANNVIPALEMFIPAAGVGIGTYAAFSTGQALNAFTMDNPAFDNLSAFGLLMSPFALLEIFAYALGISRSAILAYFLIKKRKSLKEHSNVRQYIIPTVIEIGIVIVILFIGSVIEWQVLSQRNTAAT